MSRRSTTLSQLRADKKEPKQSEPGQIAQEGIGQQISFERPPFDLFHPIQSLKQRSLVKQHQTALLGHLLDKDKEAYVERIAQDEKSQRHKYDLDKHRERFAEEDDLAEALMQSQAGLVARSQHVERLLAIHTDNQISMVDELVKDPETREKYKASIRRQAASTFVELEALALNEKISNGSERVTG